MKRVTDGAIQSVLAAGAIFNGWIDEDSSDIDGVSTFLASAEAIAF